MSRLRIATLALVTLAIASCNPVQDDAIAALGGEAPGVRRGPLHRPGQPCLLCHDGALGDPPEFTVAGTIFALPSSQLPAVNVTVSMLDARGATYEATTNAAGNFYVTPDQWTPVFPITQVALKNAGGLPIYMQSEVGRSGSCAACHVDPAGPDSPGHVCVSLDDGGVPP